MPDEKLENVLNLALEVPERERARSMDLNVGYSEAERTWDLIVKYTGDIGELVEEGAAVTELLTNYAVVTVPESQVESLTAHPRIEYVEKPKRLLLEAETGRRASCAAPVQTGTEGLTGRGVVIAVIDSGVDYWLEDFLDGEGGSRILFLWDQTIPGSPPEGYRLGTEYTKEQLDAAIASGDRSPAPSRDLADHGTPVAGIAAGNGGEGGNRYRGMAPESSLIVVKLGDAKGGFPRTTELMQAVDYAVRKMLQYGFPMVVNLSFGNTYGSHEGDSLLERYLDDISNLGRLSICVGSGNEGVGNGHAAGLLSDPPAGGAGRSGSVLTRLIVGQYETGLTVQLWKSYVDEFEVRLVTPSGLRLGPFGRSQPVSRLNIPGADVYVYYGEPIPYSSAQEIYFDFIPSGDYLDSGIYGFEFTPLRIVEGRFDLWLPGETVRGRSTRFASPSPDVTLTIPGTASGVITVGAYDSRYLTYADFSGRGYTRVTGRVKPDLAAPGVEVETVRAGGGYGTYTGTSFAAPFVSGAAALLMEWGIVRGNDPYLYGEKLKAYLHRGARPLPGFSVYPNPQVGYGALCVSESLP